MTPLFRTLLFMTLVFCTFDLPQNHTPVSEKSLIALSGNGGTYKSLMIVSFLLQPLPNMEDCQLKAPNCETEKKKKNKTKDVKCHFVKHSKMHKHKKHLKVLRK